MYVVIEDGFNADWAEWDSDGRFVRLAKQINHNSNIKSMEGKRGR